MLSWMDGVTRNDRFWNEYIRGNLMVPEINGSFSLRGLHGPHRMELFKPLWINCVRVLTKHPFPTSSYYFGFCPGRHDECLISGH